MASAWLCLVILWLADIFSSTLFLVRYLWWSWFDITFLPYLFVSCWLIDISICISNYYRKNVLASAKHYVGDGGTEKGINEGNTITSYEDLERIHLAPYLDCLSQGVCSVMASYNSWNGRKLHTDHYLLTEVLKNKLGFMVYKFEVLSLFLLW